METSKQNKPMANKSINKLVLLIPALWACFFDIVITIQYQPKEYWNGNLEMSHEGNPIGNFFMSYHVSGIFLISLLWIIFISIAGYYLPRKFARVFLMFVFIAHSCGGSTWILIKVGFWAFLIYILFNSVLFYFIEELFQRVKVKKYLQNNTTYY